MHSDTKRIHFSGSGLHSGNGNDPVATFEILDSDFLVVLGIMFGLSYLQSTGVIGEKLFQYIAIGVAVIVVVINGVMRRKVKP